MDFVDFGPAAGAESAEDEAIAFARAPVTSSVIWPCRSANEWLRKFGRLKAAAILRHLLCRAKEFAEEDFVAAERAEAVLGPDGSRDFPSCCTSMIMSPFVLDRNVLKPRSPRRRSDWGGRR